MMVVSDIEDVFVPLVDGFLVSPQEARSVVDRYVLIFLVSFSQCLYQLGKESEAMPCIFFFLALHNLLPSLFSGTVQFITF